MSVQRKLTGIVLSEYPMGENDKILTILTRERGKISVISRGCRKPKSHLHALSQAVTYGDFLVSEGRNYNYLNSGECKDTFGYIKNDLERILYSTYFAEVAEYFTVEGQDEREILNLVFVTFSAMKKDLIPLPLIRRIYEFRILMAAGLGIQCHQCIQCGAEEDLIFMDPVQGGILCGECAGVNSGIPGQTGGGQGPSGRLKVSPQVLYALQYTAALPLTEIYSFVLQGETLAGYEEIVQRAFTYQSGHRFRSEAMLDDL